MNKTILGFGAFFGLTAVILGAFGAHGLKQQIDADAIASFETGVRYQMYHALLLLFLGGTTVFDNILTKRLFYLLLIGILLFSGSIYLLATNSLTSFNFTSIALLTPIGGAFLILAWSLMLWKIIVKKYK
ncbi:DUF423 domain-containing protein [Ascidiimonas aurantiaca]|uniref:DUF423 domain-containing protein n=1 Tax=Ascidiimonas aurantiaca TaxID=1685432 RepID=UPI0030EDD298